MPLFLRLDVAPQTVLAAYRVGDSPMNVITPLMVYLPFIVVVAQRYKKDAGIGTIISLMMPYTIVIARGLDAVLRRLVPDRHPARAGLPGAPAEVSGVAFDPAPLASPSGACRRRSPPPCRPTATAVGVPVAIGGPVPEALGHRTARRLAAAGFDGRIGQTLRDRRPRRGRDRSSPSASATPGARRRRRARRRGGVRPRRRRARAARRARLRHRRRRRPPRPRPGDRRGRAARALPLRRAAARRRRASPSTRSRWSPSTEADAPRRRASAAGVTRQAATRSRATSPTRPHGHLNATRLAEVAVALGARRGVRGRAVRPGRARRARLRRPAGGQRGQRRAAADDQADATAPAGAPPGASRWSARA